MYLYAHYNIIYLCASIFTYLTIIVYSTPVAISSGHMISSDNDNNCFTIMSFTYHVFYLVQWNFIPYQLSIWTISSDGEAITTRSRY